MHQPVAEMIPKRLCPEEVVSYAPPEQCQRIIAHHGINIGKYFAETADTEVLNIRILIYDEVIIPHYKICAEHMNKYR